MNLDHRRAAAAAILAAGALLAAGSSGAAQLSLVPAEQHVDVGATGVVAVVLDEPLEVRTLEIWVRYHETVVLSESGDPGTYFTGTGCPLFPDFDAGTPGRWYAGVVTLGPDCYGSGAGELYRWEFSGLADGTCAVVVDSVKLYDPRAVRVPDVTIGLAVITVGSATAVRPPSPAPLTLALAPNPFNPRAVIRIAGPPDEQAVLTVHDLRGRLVAVPWSGRLAADGCEAVWDGRDRRGRNVPGGVYFFRLQGEGGCRTVIRGTLLE